MEKFRSFRIEDEGYVKTLLEQLTGNLSGFDASKVANEQKCRAIVLEINGKIAGFGCLTVRLVPTKGYVGTLEDIVVDKNCRGMGLGGKLVDTLIAHAKLLGLKQIDLTSNPKRIAARKLYETKGFKKIETDLFRLKL